jgi:hypothetical protein
MQNISPIKQRILDYVDNLNISKRKFYEKTGISRGTLESKTGITEEIMAKFITTYPEININWLITGEGSMLKHDNTQLAPDQSDLPPGPCRQCELRERLLAAQEERIAELREHLHDLRHQDQHKSKQRSA